jgi:hypothetical protein
MMTMPDLPADTAASDDADKPGKSASQADGAGEPGESASQTDDERKPADSAGQADSAGKPDPLGAMKAKAEAGDLAGLLDALIKSPNAATLRQADTLVRWAVKEASKHSPRRFTREAIATCGTPPTRPSRS